jgi:hypothetical protein
MAASPGLVPLCLPDPSCLTLEDMSRQGGVIMMTVSATSVGCACPRCGVHSSHIHSRYSRTLRDLPVTARWCESVCGHIAFIVGRLIVPDASSRNGCRSWFRPMGDKPVDSAKPCWRSATHWAGRRGIAWRRSWELIAAQTRSCGSSTRFRLENTPVMSKFSGWMIGPGAAAIATAQFWWI